ncbi:hypothetical protein [Sphingobacterium sp. MYb388]|uniref:hypothetical protein n=1 Tax=Sphingobacterium sp. MYb388 TaxID=2745437 RepID=UPI0030D88FFE
MDNKNKVKEILAKQLKQGVRLNLSFSALESDSGILKPELEEILRDLEVNDKYIVGFYKQAQSRKATADEFSIQLRENNV